MLEFLILKGNIVFMLGKIRDKHMKKVLWGLIAVIVPAFVLIGGSSVLRNRRKGIVGYINGKKITEEKYNYHLKMARTILLLNSNDYSKISKKNIESSAIDFLVLLWKADKEKIVVDDKEVVNFVKVRFFPEGKFDKKIYLTYIKSLSNRFNLGVSIRNFEEYIRQFLKIKKLFSLNLNIDVSDEEVKKTYIRDTQKAKIAYIGIPYKKFETKDTLTSAQIYEFYEKNKNLFRVGPKVNLIYVLVEKSNNLKNAILQKAEKIERLKELAETFSLTINETGLIGLNDPVKNIGWKPEINKIAFSLEKNKIGQAIDTDKGTIIFEKKESRDGYIPEFKEIESDVKPKLIKENAKIEAKKYCDELLKNLLNGTTTLTDIAKEEKVEIKEPPEFKYYDYIDGLGLDEKISEIVFSLEKGQVYPKILLLHNGAYLIKIQDITVFDEKDYQAKKKTYANYIKNSKELSGNIKFVSEVYTESKLKIFSILR